MNGEYGFYGFGKGKFHEPNRPEHKWHCGQSMLVSRPTSVSTPRGRTVGALLTQKQTTGTVSSPRHSTRGATATSTVKAVPAKATLTLSAPPKPAMKEDPELARAIHESLISKVEDGNRAKEREKADSLLVQQAIAENNQELQKRNREELCRVRQFALARRASQHPPAQNISQTLQRQVTSQTVHKSPAACSDTHRSMARLGSGHDSAPPAKPTIKIPSSEEAKAKFETVLRDLPSDSWGLLNHYYNYHPDKETALLQVVDAFESGRMGHVSSHAQYLTLPQLVLRHLIDSALVDRSFNALGLFMRAFPDSSLFKVQLIANLKPLIVLAINAGRHDFGRWLEKCPEIDAILTRNQQSRSEDSQGCLGVMLARAEAVSTMGQLTGRLASASTSTVTEPQGVNGDSVVYILLTHESITVCDAFQHLEGSAPRAYLLSLTKNGAAQDLVESIILRGRNKLSIGRNTTLKIYVHWPTFRELVVQEVSEAIHRLLTRCGVPDGECPQLDFNMIPDPTGQPECQQFKEDLQLALVTRRTRDASY